MKLLSIFNQNPTTVLNSSSMNAIVGGKRVLEAARMEQETLISKAQRKASRRVSGGDTTFNLRFEGQQYSVNYDASNNMLHIFSSTGEEVCVEW
jgi:hypothetical protein